MTPEARAMLRRIGAELDEHRQVRVRTGGIVLPDTAPALEAKASDNENGRQSEQSWRSRPRRPRERWARGQRTRGPRASGASTQVRGVELRTHYQAQVAELAKAYPSTQVVASDEQGMWLRVESAVLDGIGRKATFLVVVPFVVDQFPRAWAFWNFPDGSKWIGPRHTNFPDGSVCAFVPESGTWKQGGRLDALLDLYTVWALRQLFLEQFGRWPGRQFSSHPFYSLVEFKDDEFCSCDKEEPPRRYGECCKPQHLRHNLLELKADFERKMQCRLSDRNPPQIIVDYIGGSGALPSVSSTLGIEATVAGSDASRNTRRYRRNIAL